MSKLQRPRTQAESPSVGSLPPATTSKSSLRPGLQASGNGHPGERQNTDPPPRRSTKDSTHYTSTVTVNRSQGSSPESEFERIHKDELDGQNVPTNDASSPPTTDPGQHAEVQKPESRPSRSATSSKPVTSTAVKSQSEDQKHDPSTPHTAPSSTDANDRGSGRTEMAQKNHHAISYSEKSKCGPEGATPAPEPPVDDNISSRATEREPSSAPIDPTQVGRAEVADAQTQEGRSNDRGATVMRHPSSSSYASRHPIGGFASGLATLLGGRPALLVEIPRDELRQLQKEVKEGRQYRKDYENLRNEYNRVVGDARAQARYFQGVQYENQRLKERVGSLEHELKSVTKRYEDVKSLSDTRGKELVGAQVFLSKADSLSISDVTQKVNTLNQEIYQAAASLGDSIVRSKEKTSEEDSKQDVDHSKILLGPSLAKILCTAAGKVDESVHPFLVQVTLQAFLVHFCTKKIDQWAPQELPADQFLRTVYHEIRSSSTCKLS